MIKSPRKNVADPAGRARNALISSRTRIQVSPVSDKLVMKALDKWQTIQTLTAYCCFRSGSILFAASLLRVYTAHGQSNCLTLSTMVKFSTDDILKYFSQFSLGKIRKNIMKLSSAELSQRMVKAKLVLHKHHLNLRALFS